MKPEQFFNDISRLDSDLIEQAIICTKKSKQRRLIAAVASAACFIFACSAVFLFGNLGGFKTAGTESKPLGNNPSDVVSNVVSSVSSDSLKQEGTYSTEMDGDYSPLTSDQEIITLGNWEDRTMPSKFPQFNRDSKLYSATGMSPLCKLGEPLGKVTLTGFDEITNTTHSAQAELFKLPGIDTECALAVRFEGEKKVYSYVNSSYRFETLGDFISKLSLKQNLIINNGEEFSKSGRITYSNIDFEKVWNILMKNTAAENHATETSCGFISTFGFSVSLPVFGYENISLAVTKSGYLTTNILDTEKAFYIGDDAVEEVIKYVRSNCPATVANNGGSGEQTDSSTQYAESSAFEGYAVSSSYSVSSYSGKR